MKILGKLAKAYDLPGFEEFRIAHSQIHNQKRLHGTLSISIHPLDYMTMSHNACGWSSCMDWTDEGSYRRGTVEMMNSDCVVVAYLESSSPFYPLDNDFVWSNKKWRELFIVDNNVIAGVKPYPYEHTDLEKMVLDWLKELATKNCGWEYTNSTHIFSHDYHKHNDELDRDITLRFWTDAMYNDFCDGHCAYLGLDIPCVYDRSYSGPSQCLNCGDIHNDFDNEGMLVCEGCDSSTRCDHCGERHDPSYMHEMDDGLLICDYCYESYVEECHLCEGSFLRGNLSEVYLALDENHIARHIHINVDDHCWHKIKTGEYGQFFKPYTEINSVRVNGVYHRIPYINIQDLTDEGAMLFDFDGWNEAMAYFAERMNSRTWFFDKREDEVWDLDSSRTISF